MIMNESGIHTFCLKRKHSYSEIQNIIEQKGLRTKSWTSARRETDVLL